MLLYAERLELVVVGSVSGVDFVVDLLAHFPGDFLGDVATHGDVNVLANWDGDVVGDFLCNLVAVGLWNVVTNLIRNGSHDISAMCVWHFGTFGVLDHPLVLNWDLLAHTFNLGVAVGSSAVISIGLSLPLCLPLLPSVVWLPPGSWNLPGRGSHGGGPGWGSWMGWYHLGYWGGGHDLSHGGLGARVHWGGVWDGVGDHWSSDHWGASSDFSHHWGTSAHTHNSRFLANLGFDVFALIHVSSF